MKVVVRGEVHDSNRYEWSQRTAEQSIRSQGLITSLITLQIVWLGLSTGVVDVGEDVHGGEDLVARGDAPLMD